MDDDSDLATDDGPSRTDEAAMASADSDVAPDRSGPDHGEMAGGENEMAPEEGGATAGEIDLVLLDSIEQELADVELALERLGDGTYGRCETCGQVFSEEELEAAPAGRFCRAHLPLALP